MIFQGKAKVIKNIEVIKSYYKILISCPSIAKNTKPGQFIEIKASDNYEPLLRRPFSIHRIQGSNIEILYEVVGQGTQILSQKKTGEYLNVIGPSGNGFNLLPTTYYLLPILVAGGMGVAPLLFLAEQASIQHPASSIQVLIGGRTKNDILCEKEFKRLGLDVKIATDDGSRGFRGKVTDLLNKVLSSIQHSATKIGGLANHFGEPASSIYACGPRAMLKQIAVISKRYDIPAQVSLEEHMACGIGVCLGCVVNTKDGYKRVCKEGPVFEAQEIVW